MPQSDVEETLELKLQLEEAHASRDALLRAFGVAKEHRPARQIGLVASDIKALMAADRVAYLEYTSEGFELVEAYGKCNLSPEALEMKQALLERSLRAGISLVSTHPDLDPTLANLAARCREKKMATHVILVATPSRTYGAFVAHWIQQDRPGDVARNAFACYLDLAIHSLAANMEKNDIEAKLEEVRRHAYFDGLTGLPSGLHLEERLRELEGTELLSVISLDFDGMREANNSLGYEKGGDVLIKLVGEALGNLTLGDEFPARQHRGGDEFAILLPGISLREAALRAVQVEAALDQLEVPLSHRNVYRGASVGHATLLPGESPSLTLNRAIEAMVTRKAERNKLRALDLTSMCLPPTDASGFQDELHRD